MKAITAETVGWVERLHGVTDELTRPVAEKHAARLRCREGCADCCTDGLTAFTIEAARIVAKHGALLEAGTPHPPGACAFLDARGSCRIYEERPYVCRTQGLPLRWLDEEEDDDGGVAVVERRDVCPKNDDEEMPLEGMEPEDLFTLGPLEQRLLARQLDHDGGTAERVELRSLFAVSRDRVRLPILR